MQARGKIAVILPLVSAVEESDLLKGIQLTANKLGYDVLVFTNSSNSQPEDNESDYVTGEEDIFSLLKISCFDGILFCAGRFENYNVRNRIAELLKDINVPTLAIEWEKGEFPSYSLSEKEAFRQITSHLIDVHGYRKIYCLTGPKDCWESCDRLEGWHQALLEHDIIPAENWLFYGDFWKQKAQQLARDMASGIVEKPDAVVCANDVMAVSLCEELKMQNISVPGQIAVTGFEGNLMAELSEPTITTVGRRNIRLGENAAGILIERITGEKFATGEDDFSLTLGQSCGCHKTKHDPENNRYYDWVFEKNLYKQLYLNCNYEMEWYTADNFTELAEKIGCYAYFIPYQSQIDICLCEEWCSELNSPDESEGKRFSENTLLLLSKKGFESFINDHIFPSEHLLPTLQKPHKPLFIVLQPLHFKGHIFGYCAVYYDNGGDYFMDEHYLRWRNAVINSLVFLKEKMYHKYISQQLDELSIKDPISDMYNEKGFRMQFDPFLKKIRKSGCHAGIMMISWNYITVPHSASGEKISLLFAHALQLLCSSDLLTARFQERIFIILFPITNLELLEEFETTLLFRIERTLRTIQEAEEMELPDLTAISELIPEGSLTLPDLKDLTEKLKNKMNISTKQHTNFTAELKAIRRQIRISPENSISAEEAAAMLKISQSYFVHLFRTQFGIPYNEEIIQARLHKAKKLLKETDLSIKEIAGRCGYASPNHFMRQFKIRTNTTAVEYRKTHCIMDK